MSRNGPQGASLPRRLRDAFYEGQPLTKREHDVIRLYALGYTGTQVALKLGIGWQTVKQYNKRILSKLKANTMAQAVGIAVSLDLI